MKKKILILGINSFLGSCLLKELIKDKEFFVYGTYNKNYFRINKYLIKYKKNIFKVDLKKTKKKLKNIFIKIQPHIIINFAGYSDPQTLTSENSITQIIRNITRSLKVSKIKLEHFYNIGSCEEYIGSKLKLKENSKIGSNSLYGKDKIFSHKHLLNFSKINKIKYTNLRTFNIIGKDNFKKNIITYIISNNNFEKLNFHNLYAIRDFMWIDDYIFIIKSIIMNNNNYKVLNIGTGKGTSILKILKYVSEHKKNFIEKKYLKKNLKIKLHNIKVANNDRLKKIIKSYKFITTKEIIKKLI